MNGEYENEVMESTEMETNAPEIYTEALVAELEGCDDVPADDAAEEVQSSGYETTALDGSRCAYGSPEHRERLLKEAEDDPYLRELLRIPMWPLPRASKGGEYLAATSPEHRKTLRLLDRKTRDLEQWGFRFNGNVTLLEMVREAIGRGDLDDDEEEEKVEGVVDAFDAVLRGLREQNEALKDIVRDCQTVQ
jgi:hypothetical protein